MDVVIIINRAGSKGLIDLCMHGIMHLNLDRNCGILREGRFIYPMRKVLRMVITCWSKVHIGSYLGRWPVRDT